MREIKFRVWDDFKKEWLGKSDKDSLTFYGFHLAGEVMSVQCPPQWALDPCCTVEQYTGLKDKNGKEIYEGDIVKWLDGLNEYIEFKVEWQDNRARFCLRNEYSVFDYEDLNEKKKPYIEVIGNIHENPELLGGEE